MDHWDQLADRWDSLLADGESFVNHEESFRRFHWFMKRMIKIGNRTRTFRLLDLGCGTGEAAWPLWKRVASVTFYDRSPAMLRLARNKYPKGVFVRGDAAHLPFLDAEFDVIVSRGALLSQFEPEHIPDYLAHVWRVMRPGAHFMFDFVCNAGSWELAFLDSRLRGNDTKWRAWNRQEMTDLVRQHLPAAVVVAYDGSDRHAMNRIVIKK